MLGTASGGRADGAGLHEHVLLEGRVPVAELLTTCPSLLYPRVHSGAMDHSNSVAVIFALSSGQRDFHCLAGIEHLGLDSGAAPAPEAGVLTLSVGSASMKEC